jgi:hypothetical protein
MIFMPTFLHINKIYIYIYSLITRIMQVHYFLIYHIFSRVFFIIRPFQDIDNDIIHNNSTHQSCPIIMYQYHNTSHMNEWYPFSNKQHDDLNSKYIMSCLYSTNLSQVVIRGILTILHAVKDRPVINIAVLFISINAKTTIVYVSNNSWGIIFFFLHRVYA